MKLFLFIIMLFSIFNFILAQINTTNTTNVAEEECQIFYSIIGENDGSCCSEKKNIEANERSAFCENGHVTIVKLKGIVLRNDIDLEEIPKNLFKLKNLKELNMEFNKISSISPLIQELTELEILNLRNNYIKELPDELYTLKKLRVLNLYRNQIKTLSPAIGQLTELEELSIGKNKISNFPEAEIKNLKKLKSFETKEDRIFNLIYFPLVFLIGFGIVLGLTIREKNKKEDYKGRKTTNPKSEQR